MFAVKCYKQFFVLVMNFLLHVRFVSSVCFFPCVYVCVYVFLSLCISALVSCSSVNYSKKAIKNHHGEVPVVVQYECISLFFVGPAASSIQGS